MRRDQYRLPSNPGRTFRKLLLSFFVVVSFAVYAAVERLTKASAAPAADSPATPSPDASSAGGASAQSSASGPVSTVPPQAKAAAPTTTSGFKDGTYQGQPVDAYYGLVQVQVNIQHGAISGVQFLQYPHDRATSQEINAQVMPWLQQEAIQAQSANVDIISGATLTSEGFQMSLQTALQSAHN